MHSVCVLPCLSTPNNLSNFKYLDRDFRTFFKISQFEKDRTNFKILSNFDFLPPPMPQLEAVHVARFSCLFDYRIKSLQKCLGNIVCKKRDSHKIRCVSVAAKHSLALKKKEVFFVDSVNHKMYIITCMDL